MSSPPVIFLVGPAGAGKTTARNILAKLTHLKGGSCSDVIYAFLAFRKGVSQESLRQLPKESFRAQLIEAGDFMVDYVDKIAEVPVNKEVDGELYRIPSALIRTLYQNGYNIIDGVRRHNELQEAISHLDWNGIRSLVIKVMRKDVPNVTDNAEDVDQFVTHHVCNDDTPDELEAKLKKILEDEFGPQTTEHPDIPIIDLPMPAVAAATAKNERLSG